MLSHPRRCRFAMRILDLPTAHIYWLRIIALRGLHGDVAKKELNLLQFAAGGTAEASATSTEVVGRQVC